jgi:hypothetical protein
MSGSQKHPAMGFQPFVTTANLQARKPISGWGRSFWVDRAWLPQPDVPLSSFEILTGVHLSQDVHDP